MVDRDQTTSRGLESTRGDSSWRSRMERKQDYYVRATGCQTSLLMVWVLLTKDIDMEETEKFASGLLVRMTKQVFQRTYHWKVKMLRIGSNHGYFMHWRHLR